MDYFSKEEADVIGEISNISIGSSATAMNMMLGQPILITTPDVSLVHKDEILNDYEKSCVLIRVQYTQGLYGNNILILKDDDAKKSSYFGANGVAYTGRHVINGVTYVFNDDGVRIETIK